MNLRLIPETPERVRWRHLRAFTSTLVESPQSHHANDKAWSVRPLVPLGDAFLLRIGLLEDQLEDRLRARLDDLQNSGGIRVGTQAHLVEEPVVEQAVTWEELATQAAHDDELSLQFDSPTVFLHGKRQLPWPNPIRIFLSLERRWFDSASRSAVSGTPWAEDVSIRDYEVATGTIIDSHWNGRRWVDRPFVGFHGRVALDLARLDRPTRQWAHALARLSSYSGVGANATIGMGAARPVDP